MYVNLIMLVLIMSTYALNKYMGYIHTKYKQTYCNIRRCGAEPGKWLKESSNFRILALGARGGG